MFPCAKDTRFDPGDVVGSSSLSDILSQRDLVSCGLAPFTPPLRELPAILAPTVAKRFPILGRTSEGVGGVIFRRFVLE